MMSSPTPAELQTMLALAEKATPGPWKHPRGTSYVDGETSIIGNVARTVHNADAAFIAAANPQAVMSLIDALVSARAALQDFADMPCETIGLDAEPCHHHRLTKDCPFCKRS